MHCYTASNTTISTSLPRGSFKKRRATSSSCSFKLGTRRAKQRWSALVSAPTSRLAKYMRARLGEAPWADFVCHANRFYKDAYVCAFQEHTLRCVGPLGGGPCPHGFEVDLTAPDAGCNLEFLHLDHERPVPLTCARWAMGLSVNPTAWDDGLDGGELCHSLFGVEDNDVHGERCLRFRCGARRGAGGERVHFAHHSYCHTS